MCSSPADDHSDVQSQHAEVKDEPGDIKPSLDDSMDDDKSDNNNTSKVKQPLIKVRHFISNFIFT